MEYQNVKVLRIDEPDFGCEGRPDNCKVMNKVYIEKDQREMVLEMEEKRLWKSGLDVGDITNLIVDETSKVILEMKRTE